MTSFQTVAPREVKLTTRTEVSVFRTVPSPHLRRIGAWIFVDHFGPTEHVTGMTVAQHPHTGLQTVTWLFEGSVDHRDSIGSVQQIRPGQLNLMTAGDGVAHSERSLPGDSERMHAVQLWLALPESRRSGAADFQHLDSVPELRHGEAEFKVFIGEYQGVASAAKVYHPTLGAEMRLDGEHRLQLQSGWEYGLLLVSGELWIDGAELPLRHLASLEPGIDAPLLVGRNAVAVLLGGLPFAEPIVMWWNFLARSQEEIVEMRERWNGRGYPAFQDELGGWIPAPELPNVSLRAR